MPKTNALPRPIGATVLALSLALAAAVILPASSLAAPPEGASPTLAISPSPATFPTTTVGNQSPNQEFDIVNEGGAEAWIEKTVVVGPESAAFNLTGSNCGSLQPGDHCKAWISFVPGSVGAKSATLSFQFGGGGEQGFELSGSAVAPQLTFTPGSHDFGIQQVNRGGSTNFQLTNSGEAGVQLNNFEIAGPGSNSFWTGSSDCWGRWLNPGESCWMEVSFSPREMTAYEAELRVSANGSSFTAALSGEGGLAFIEPSESPVDLGSATVGTIGPVRAITLTNSGNYPGNFFIGVVAGGDAGSFRLLDENCTNGPVMPAAGCTAHVRFTPQDIGVKTARLAFFGDSEGGAMVPLTGEGVAPAVTLVPSGFDFGEQAAGSKSAGHSFAVRNEGGAPLSLGGVGIAGVDLDQFALSGDECSGVSLVPGAECLVRVRFAPDSPGAKAAVLRVGSDAGALTASLTGLGVAAPSVTSAAAPQVITRWRNRGRRFGHGATLSAARARCRVVGGCRTKLGPQVRVAKPRYLDAG